MQSLAPRPEPVHSQHAPTESQMFEAARWVLAGLGDKVGRRYWDHGLADILEEVDRQGYLSKRQANP